MEDDPVGEHKQRRLMEPPKIRRLEESVVNRIAAGEVVQRPASAVKELVENSLDAGSTSVSIVIKDGGLKLIQVSDNGHGIRYEDLPILCERHTTSKLSAYEDLQTINSMGFRGEALASMSYVGHVSVTTITEGQLHGYRVSYRDGVMEQEPKPCAAIKGTQILVENLFYNMVARKKTLQNSNDDYSKIVDLISRFAIHHISVSFSCRKHGANRADVHTVASCSKLEAIRSVYGVSTARNLMEITATDDDPARSVFKMDGYISDSNYAAKKSVMVLFINDRLVECTFLKRAIEVVYSATLPKASKPFIYLSIKLPPEHVDVNIHPTKREVSLLNQESIIETIQSAVEDKLLRSNTARTFNTQAINSSPSFISGNKEVQSKSLSETKSFKDPVHKMVRTDSRDPVGRLHAYFPEKDALQNEKRPDLSTVRSAVKLRRNPKEAADLGSIQEVANEIDSDVHSALLEIVRDCTYVGMADDIFALCQHETRLYLLNVVNDAMHLTALKPCFLPLPKHVSRISPGPNYDYHSSIMRFVISSPVMPDATVDYNLSSGKWSIVLQQNVFHERTKTLYGTRPITRVESPEIPKNNLPPDEEHDSDVLWNSLSEYYACEYYDVASEGGVVVPLTVVYSKKHKKEGSPGLLHVHGAYGELLDKGWRYDLKSLLDRGWVIAYADVRGGGGRGKRWHHDGRGTKKQNSIKDFISCAQFLTNKDIIHYKKLAGWGYSAGGLLVASAINECPDLFRAAVLKVPFLDACNTLLYPVLPITPIEYEEFGFPGNLEEFKAIRNYSPYENIRKDAIYPAVLLSSSFNTRFGIWEATKWIAKVRELTFHDPKRPKLLNLAADTLEESKYLELKELALETAFLIKMMMMDP